MASTSYGPGMYYFDIQVNPTEPQSQSSGGSSAAEVAGSDQNVRIESRFERLLHQGREEHWEPATVETPLRSFFENPRPIINNIFAGYIDDNAEISSIIDDFVPEANNIGRSIATNPNFSGPVVPVFLQIRWEADPDEDEDEDEDEEVDEAVFSAVSEISFAEEGIRNIPAAESAIERLEEVGDHSREEYYQHQCCICLEEFGGPTLDDDDDDDKIVRMPCMHVFHRKCIVNWLRRTHWCPLCRHIMPISATTSPDR